MTNDFKNTLLLLDRAVTRRAALEVLQVNLGNLCNQQCTHCHMNAGPEGRQIMSRPVMDDIVHFLSETSGLVLDITGGCPELNPDFAFFIETAQPFTAMIKVRSNLTVLFEPGMAWLPEFYKKYKLKLVCSMPCYTKENVDRQRGAGVFDKSIRALRLLNDLGYGTEKDLQLDLVYNPGGPFLPGNQKALEEDYRKNLGQYRVTFDHLITITNAPINRFEHRLMADGRLDDYMKLLTENFNREVIADIMCRHLLSVGWDGTLYDCDFNQALELPLRDDTGRIMNIRALKRPHIENKEIIFKNHCYCCVAGAGSSCKGALNPNA